MNDIINTEEFLRQVIEDSYAECVCTRNPAKSIDKLREMFWNTMDTLELKERANNAVTMAS